METLLHTVPGSNTQKGLQQRTDIYDVAIIGAGGAGMCLLLSLYQKGYLRDHRVAVLEPLAKNSNDRTWCFWAKPDEPIVRMLKPVISASWQKTMNTHGRVELIAPYTYYQIRSKDLYTYVKNILSSEKVDWIAEKAEKVQKFPAGYQISAENADLIAGKVFDSRLSQGQINDLASETKLLWQSFYGWRIKTSNAAFDPETFSLMAFDIDQANSTQFVYVLPYSENEALVEMTRFSHELLDLNYAAGKLGEWINRKYGDFNILETEIGKIPMSLGLSSKITPEAQKDAIPIGTAAGAVKATTGYAFKRMFDHARSIADALQKGDPLPSIPHNPKAAFYDSLLIHILKNKPHRGRSVFTSLFNKISTTRILKFLDEKTTFKEDIPILSSLPFFLFMRSLIQVYFKGKQS